jgi:hypothetical protein
MDRGFPRRSARNRGLMRPALASEIRDGPTQEWKRSASRWVNRAVTRKSRLLVPVFLGVRLRRLLRMLSRVHAMPHGGVSVVGGLLVISVLVMLGGLVMVTSGMHEMF